MYKDQNEVPKKLSGKMEMTLVVTMHCIDRLRERLIFLREADESFVMSNLNSQLSEGILYKDGSRGALLLGFEGVNFRFVVVDTKDGLYRAVTFEHSVKYPKGGKSASIKYVHWDEVYTKDHTDKLLRGRTDPEYFE
ncbi:MAG: hypothetical protein BK997_01420 [Candidatus Micrarchaeum sp. ARMAN-1]|nr:MAG: hypothetical protein BK997_01420 [Candidatus Micrarchaeum sp. ARMAN-1]